MVSARGWASLRARGALSLASPPVPHGLTSQPLPSVLSLRPGVPCWTRARGKDLI